MATLAETRQNLRALKRRRSVYKIALQAAKQFEAYLIDLNQLQLSEGLDIFGNVIGTYSEATEKIAQSEFTRRPKVAGERYNFEWSGELFDKMKVKVTSTYLEIYSTDRKAALIVEKFSSPFTGEGIFGLTEESLKEFVDEKVLPAMQLAIWQTLDLTD